MPISKHLVTSALWLALAAVLATGGRAAFGDRPKTPEVLPEDTVAYLRVDDAQEFLSQLKDTAIGRMLRDPEVRPFVEHVFGSAEEAFSGTEDDMGLSFDKLLGIPQDEICVAVVRTKQGPPALVVLVEAGKQIGAARKLVEYVQAKMEESGGLKGSETWQGTKLTVLQESEESNSHVVFFERDETIAVVSDLEIAKQVLSAWQGAEKKTLANRREFAAIMDQCDASGGEQPQLTYFVDPARLFKSITSGNMALQMWISLLGPLGLDGLQGFGGSLVLDDERFESIHHTHVLLESPPMGVLEILALRPGDVTPEVWIPNDVATYMTVHWDFPKSYSALVDVYEFFKEEGGWTADVAGPLGKRFGVDIEKDILEALEGRITRVTWIDDSASRQATLLGLKLKDAAAFRLTLGKMADREQNLFAKRTVAGINSYHFSSRRAPSDGDRVMRRLPDSHVAIFDDYLLLTDSEKLLERVVATKKGESQPLGKEFDFRLIASKITRTADGSQPSMVWFKRPEVTLRATYEMIRAEETINRLSTLAEANAMFRAVYEALSEHPLPPFEVLEKYFAVSGGLATSDETGFHFVGFTYRRK